MGQKHDTSGHQQDEPKEYSNPLVGSQGQIGLSVIETLQRDTVFLKI